MRGGSGRRLTVLGVVLGLVLTGTGCGAEAETENAASKPDVRLVTDGRLTVCSHPPYPPFEYREDGDYVGLDVAVVDLVAKRLGVRRKLVETPYDDLMSGKALSDRTCDVAAAALPITKQYEKDVDLSDSYFEARQALLVPAGEKYDDLASLKGEKVGVENGSTGEKYVRKQIKKHKIKLKVVPYEDVISQQEALESGKITAAVNNLALWAEYLKDHRERYRVGERYDTDEKYGIAVRTGNSRLLGLVNDVIARARRDGTYDKIYRKWIGVAPD